MKSALELHIENKYVATISTVPELSNTVSLLIPGQRITLPFIDDEIYFYQVDNGKLTTWKASDISDEPKSVLLPNYVVRVFISSDIFQKLIKRSIGSDMLVGLNEDGQCSTVKVIKAIAGATSEEELKKEKVLSKCFALLAAGQYDESSRLAAENDIEEGYRLIVSLMENGGLVC